MNSSTLSPPPTSAGLDLGVVVPLYNKQSTVERAVESLLTQTEKPRRIVVVDDGSTDGSLRALAPYRDAITILRQANAGPSAARNRGIQELDTEWVAFADADNCWHADRVASVHRMIQLNPELEWMTGRYLRCVPDGSTSILPAIPVIWEATGGIVDYFQWTATGVSGVHASETLVAKRSLLNAAGCFERELRCHEITLMYLSLAVRSSTCGVVGPPTVDVYFDRPDSLYSSLKGSSTAMLAYAKALARLSENAGSHRELLRVKAADAMHTALWLALNDGSLAVSREIIFAFGSLLRLKARAKGYLRYAYQSLRSCIPVLRPRAGTL